MSRAEKKRQQIEITSYIFGLINILVFGSMLGDMGIAFFILGLECLFFVSSLTAGNLMDTLGKILRVRNQKGQYINARKVSKCVLIVQGGLGIVVAVIFACFAGVLANKFFEVRYCSFIIMLMALIYCIRNISAILIGFSQGEGSELPRAVSAFLRQVLVLGFGCVFVKILQQYGDKVSNLLGDTSYIAMYGSMGLVLALLLAEILILLFLTLITLGNKNKLFMREDRGMRQMESCLNIMQIFYGSMSIGILTQSLGFFPLWAGAVFYRKSIMDVGAYAVNYGVFVGKYLAICAIPALLIMIFLTNSHYKSVDAFRKEDYREAKGFFQGGMHEGIVHAIFWTVFIAVLSEMLAGIISPVNTIITAEMLRFGSLIILFGSLLWYFVKQLGGMKKKIYALGSFIFGDVVFVALYFTLQTKGNMGVMALVYATMAALFAGCSFAGVLCYKFLHCGIDWLRFIAIPCGSGCLVGIVILLLEKVFVTNLGIWLTTILCYIVSVILYWVILIMFRCFDAREIKYLPSRALIAKINKVFGIF